MTRAGENRTLFGDLGVAIVTPFTQDGEHVDHDALAHLTRTLVDQGHNLLVANGTTGESPTTSDEEKHAVVRTVREAAGDGITVLAGAGTNDTRHSLALARDTKENGHADGLLLATPYYNKPTQRGLIEHTLAIAEATDLPIMLYDIPGRSGIPIEYESAVELAQHPNIVALKEAKADLHEGSKLIANTGLALYSGEDALNLPWLAVGAAGFVSVVSHVTGPLDRAQLDAVKAGDLDRARRIHAARTPFVDALMNQAPGTMATKAALAMQGVLPHARTRGPLGDVPSEAHTLIREVLDTLPGVLESFGIDQKK